jgi:predicted enzyme related to lactoylglutathione lyase
MAAPVVHWEINAKDGKRAQEFYASLFEWKVNANNEMNYGLVDTGSKLGAGGGIGQQSETQPAPNVTFYVQVNDLQAYLSKAETLGGRTVVPPTEIAGMNMSFAMFADPEGNTIGLIKGMQVATRKAARRRPARKAKKVARAKKARGKKRR